MLGGVNNGTFRTDGTTLHVNCTDGHIGDDSVKAHVTSHPEWQILLL